MYEAVVYGEAGRRDFPQGEAERKAPIAAGGASTDSEMSATCCVAGSGSGGISPRACGWLRAPSALGSSTTTLILSDSLALRRSPVGG